MRKIKKYKLCRRLGEAIFEKCQNQKFTQSLARKKKKGRRPRSLSTYAAQLLEKQKTRFSYGITETQLSNYVDSALEQAMPAQKLFEGLEFRLDNTVYRLGLAKTRRMARQMVSHGHFLVNGRRVTIPSYRLKMGDKVNIRSGSHKSKFFENLEQKLKDYRLPEWLKFDINNLQGEVKSRPEHSESPLDLNAILEFYSR